MQHFPVTINSPKIYLILIHPEIKIESSTCLLSLTNNSQMSQPFNKAPLDIHIRKEATRVCVGFERKNHPFLSFARSVSSDPDIGGVWQFE